MFSCKPSVWPFSKASGALVRCAPSWGQQARLIGNYELEWLLVSAMLTSMKQGNGNFEEPSR